MFKHTISLFQQAGDKMNDMMKAISLMAAGSMLTLMYQRYNEPMMCAMKKAVHNTMDAAENKLEEMM